MPRKPPPKPPVDLAPGLVVRRVALDAIHPDPANTNTHDGRNLAAIVASLRTFGQVEALVVQKGTGKIIGGNGRLEAMRSIGMTEADIVEVEADNVHAAALGIALNRTAKLSAFDDVALARTLEAIRSEPDFPLEATGFEDAEVGALLDRIAGERIGGGDGGDGDEGGIEEIHERHEIIVECDGEGQQRQLFDRFQSEGLKCRVVTF
jgi:ParB-like chromosome segregation protein Spo0J